MSYRLEFQNDSQVKFSCKCNFDHFVFSNVSWARAFMPHTPICVTLTYDLEIQVHMNLHGTLPISATTHAEAVEIGKIKCKITLP